MGHRLHEEPDDVEVHSFDARRVGAAGQVDVQAGHVEVGLDGYRVRGGAGGADPARVVGRAQDVDAVTAIDQTLRDVQQGTDVAERRQRGNENFWHGSMLGEWPRSSLEVLWRSSGDCR